MPISFNATPAALRVPLVSVEFDSSQAIQGPSVRPLKTLLIGQRLASGTVAALTALTVTSAAQAATAFGAGSMLAEMAAAALLNAGTGEIVALALDDDPAGVAAQGSLTFGGAASAAATLPLYIGGRRIAVAVAAGDSGATVAAAVVAAGAIGDLPATLAVDGLDPAKVLVTARHKGEAGNGLDLRIGYHAGEALPAGLTAAVVEPAGGAGNPDVAAIFAALGDEAFETMALPYQDGANLAAVAAELESRWGPLKMIEGVAFAAARGTLGQLSALGETLNSPFLSVMAASGSPTPPWAWAAALAALTAAAASIDPARPFQTLALAGVLAPAKAQRFTLAERNLLLFDGLATHGVDAGGTVRVERLITSYRTNAAGAPDESLLDVNTVLTLGYLRFDWRARLRRKYPRHKLAGDGTAVAPGQAIVTPKIMKAEAVAWFRDMESLGLVEGFEQFKRDLLVERSATDPNRLDIYLPPDVVNGLRVVAVQLGFRL